jgi:hypothetical protein
VGEINAPLCPVAGCTRPRRDDAFCCRSHWLAVPFDVRQEIVACEKRGDAHGKRVTELAALQVLNARVPAELKVARG